MTPDLLLDTAIDQFGRLGFEGASTRAIATASGTAMSAITYHFGGKKGLYLAAAQRIATGIAEAQAPRIAHVHERFAQEPGEAAALVAELIDGFAQMMVMPKSETWARFVSREQQEPTEAFEVLHTGVMSEMQASLIMLIEAARPNLLPMEARACAIQIMGQALILRAGRASVCRILGIEKLEGKAVDIVLFMLRQNIMNILQPIEHTQKEIA